MIIRMIPIIVAFLSAVVLSAQQIKDTTPVYKKIAEDVTVVGLQSKRDVLFMPEIVGTNINAGKKNSLVILNNPQANTVNNTMRQIIAKVPGIHIWESDGSGIQIGVASRGLSPNRSWEFNTRQNGYDIAADPFGYPEAYYNPPMETVQRIEILRGSAALQYGPQFGGLINYILKNGSQIKKPIQFETQNTIGSNALTSTFNAIGGTYKKVHYYAFADFKNADGWMENSKYNTKAYAASVTYNPSEKLKLNVEYTHSSILSQQPGGLTDAQFAIDNRKSSRSRNWFQIDWDILAAQVNYNLSKKTKLNSKIFAIHGDRNSVGYLRAINIPDTINANTLNYNPRTVDIDLYRNYGWETRTLSQINIGKQVHYLSAGVRLYTGTTERFRNGRGTTGSRYDKTITGSFPTDLNFTSDNLAAFSEAVFKINDKIIVMPGIRAEYIRAHVEGQNGLNSSGQPIQLVPQTKQRSFILAALSAEYHFNNNTELYTGIAECYRPIQFADLITPPTTDLIDPNLKDSKGYNAEIGIRGTKNDFLTYDASLYYLHYGNRIGSITQQRLDGSFYNLRTNVGTSVSKGFESMIDANIEKMLNYHSKIGLNVFASYAYNESKYQSLRVVTKNSANQLVTTNLANKQVENAPKHILRSGFSIQYKKLTATSQVSYTSNSFSDANNTTTPSANGQVGPIPAYTILDCTLGFKLTQAIQLKMVLNNATNTKYFTRRAGGYPGPGILTADGRTVQVTLSAKL